MKPYLMTSDGKPVKAHAGMIFHWSKDTTYLRIKTADGSLLRFSDGTSKTLFPGGGIALIRLVQIVTGLTGLHWKKVNESGEGVVAFELIEREEEESSDD